MFYVWIIYNKENINRYTVSSCSFSSRGADIIGFEPEELEKRSFYILIHPEDLASVAACHKMCECYHL